MPPLDPAALNGPTAARGPSRMTTPVLIRVPAIATPPGRRPSTGYSARPRRRRLKREFRVAFSALLLGVPIAGASSIVVRSVASGPARSSVVEAATLASFEPAPVISLRIEPESAAPFASPASTDRGGRNPVALGGDRLPDDGSMEGSAHAGS